MKEVKETYRKIGLGQTVGTFALGAAAGSIIALLFAPASGRVTRRRISLKVRAMRRQAIVQVARTQKLLARKADYLREATSEKLHDAKEWVADRFVHGNGHERRRPVRHA